MNIVIDKDGDDFSWVGSFTFDIGNTARTSKGGNGVAILMLHEKDSEEIGQGIFGYGKRFRGVAIYLNTILNAPNEGMNYIQGFVNDGTKLVNPMKIDPEASCME